MDLSLNSNKIRIETYYLCTLAAQAHFYLSLNSNKIRIETEVMDAVRMAMLYLSLNSNKIRIETQHT